jgi:uncharacterized protein YjiS (DUF1127 family)
MKSRPMTSRVDAAGGMAGQGPFGAFLGVWLERWRQRRKLARLDRHLLDDIGLSSEDVARETAKPFWRP